ncbi:putative PQQ-dependent glucose dehydrogenase [Halosimplex carlsbadense 2-9-1]|uniref:Putative PQQ-dependent glucose dehydrogenase n=1 Tax=Halosimplex carlsbadense 2-9-1 TaxID=797114 RepID=M0CP18_9EURY|nr:PQQ-dependent sugar dehydrogenase [Halosimplex carlsbadense]ELZ24142.1 putative PQQ-dependent glucose dehydrogenase [Halosimplex carlsbadense 2-9-1]
MTDEGLTRRRALAMSGLALTGGLAGCGSDSDGDGPGGEPSSPGDTATRGSGGDTPTDGSTESTGGADTGGDGTPAGTAAFEDLTVRAERVASGFTSPLALSIPEPGRRFVVDQSGQIHLYEDGRLREEPFLDVSDRMVDVGGYSEQGLLGLAFHPEFAENGRFFVRYSAPAREWVPDDYSHTFVCSEFRADPGAATADPGSERVVVEIAQPQSNHNAGAIAFGPDGYLYVATGDGGRANDQGVGHVDDWYDAVGGGNGQDVTENLLGSMLRIDVDGEASGTPSGGGGGTTAGSDGPVRDYAVPEDNPLVGSDGLDEQYAWGFRNPWRFSFGPDDRLFVGDVGQGAWEEVSVVERGGNYGWNVKEGTHCFQAEDCPSESPRGRPLRDPVIEYPHGGADVSGIAVIGGYRYGGDAIPDLRGRYLFADWRAGGRLFAARETDEGLWPTTTVSVDSNEQFGPMVLSFGRNPAGELFVCTTASGQVSGESGAVFRLTGA